MQTILEQIWIDGLYRRVGQAITPPDPLEITEEIRENVLAVLLEALSTVYMAGTWGYSEERCVMLSEAALKAMCECRNEEILRSN